MSGIVESVVSVVADITLLRSIRNWNVDEPVVVIEFGIGVAMTSRRVSVGFNDRHIAVEACVTGINHGGLEGA